MIRKVKNIHHFVKALIGNVILNQPAKNTIIIGVTGTDGKTTTASMIYHILYLAGFKTSLVSTVGAYINGEEYDTGLHVTTPSNFSILKYIKLAKDQNVQFVVLEVTSHALDQHRVYGINFKVSVLTNVSHEHLDYHKTYENYLRTKAKIFKMSETIVLNKDDESYKKIVSLKLLPKGKKIITYGEKNADLTTDVLSQKLPLKERFNLFNMLAAIAVTTQLGVPQIRAVEYLKSFKRPVGRQEIVYSDAFSVMIDFAHTPNSFASLLSEVRKSTKGRIIHVFGSAGQRDKSKRPDMGRQSSKYADIIILTAEDPRNEDVSKICSEIESGISKEFSVTEHLLTTDNKKYAKILDRKSAINTAIRIARLNDFVVITGKGHEKSMNIKGVEYPWSDSQEVENALKLHER